MSERTAVYRLYDADKVLLYVGIAADFGKRWQQHAHDKPWWADVQRQTIDWYPDRQAALSAEAEAIRDEKPLHNVALTPRQFPPRHTEPASNFGTYVGSYEISRILGVSRQRVQVIVSRQGFPRPYDVLAMGKVWRRKAVEQWARDHGRTLAGDSSAISAS